LVRRTRPVKGRYHARLLPEADDRPAMSPAPVFM
jgi:hypothetical protein